MTDRLADGLTKRKWPGKGIPATPAAGGKKLLWVSIAAGRDQVECNLDAAIAAFSPLSQW